ncbi:NAD-dependent epimerase/dehydratase family protein [Nitriliruptor alkaliphilus]|uniref:NAD-dependent epimerase/dehydratase family protein n=1 Tax=Nitriliruptor alkaliphilus TaxID=427918 RepID=UPI0006989CC1|nr:NAD-dependent epimerase/dehydratase family protein [Nitriliruptor alkaliphilus]
MAREQRVVVTGATGNVGLRVVEVLAGDADVSQVVGLARRPPAIGPAGVRWVSMDLTPRPPGTPGPDPLDAVLAGADALVHLAWLIQPSRDPGRLWEVNAAGTARLLAAASRAGVRTIVHASSVGTYAPAPLGTVVDEGWPTHGIATSPYSLGKAYCERLLDAYEAGHPEVRVVRLRPSLVVQRRSAAHVRRLFAGALVPDAAFGAVRRLPVLPDVPGLTVQLAHAEDVADAFRAAVVRDVRGPFNLAAPPALSVPDIAALLGARTVPVPPRLVRALVRAGWTARVLPVDVGWFDLALRTPQMRTDRAAAELGWAPRWDASEAVVDVLEGLAQGAGDRTPPLEGDADRSRVTELVTARQGGGEVR